jgi:ATP-dependent Clp protease ATP-binding subunit ClpA
MSAPTIGFVDTGTGDAYDDRIRRAADSRSKTAIEKIFSPEFRNRLDAIVTFRPLSSSVMQDIVEKFMLQLEQQLAERHVAITLTPEARAWLAVKGYDVKFGARPLGRVVQREVRDPLTDEILFGALEQGGTVTIGLAEDRLQFAFEGKQPPAAASTGQP